MDMSDLQEHLLRLYLRLNGFFTSGFIVHSSESAKNKTEVDTIAVRFPNNGEPERQVKPDSWLDLSKHHVEFAICEAKTKPRFNRALYSDTRAIETILRWGGMFTQATLIKLVPEVQGILSPESKPTPIIRRTEPHDGVIVRSLLFCPKLAGPDAKQSWFVGSDAAFKFIFSCLSPASQPPTCGRRYGAAQWAELAPLVNLFKKWGGSAPPTYEAFEKEMRKSYRLLC
jgi:hypothetical protein